MLKLLGVYNAFLIVMSQLASQKKARVVIQDQLIFIEETGEENQWRLSSPVFRGEGYLPSNLFSCVSSRGIFCWQHQKPHLRLNPETHSVDLIHTVEIKKGKYLPFRELMSTFVQMAQEWKKFLLHVAEKDPTFIS